MLTPLRRYEAGKTLLGLIPIVVASCIASRIFTELPPKLIIALVISMWIMAVVGIFILPPSMEEKTKKGDA